MYIPNDATRYANSSPGPRDQFFVNHDPVTFDIIMWIAVVFFVILLQGPLSRWLESCIIPDDDADPQNHQQEQGGEDKHLDAEKLPLRPSPTADGEPRLDDGLGGKYKTFHSGDMKWYKADGVQMSYDEWIEIVFDPLD